MPPLNAVILEAYKRHTLKGTVLWLDVLSSSSTSSRNINRKPQCMTPAQGGCDV